MPDPARFSFAHGGKDGHPFPVLIKVYDETTSILQKAKPGTTDKNETMKKLHQMAVRTETDFILNENFDQLLQKERDDLWK